MKNILSQKYIDNVSKLCERFNIYNYDIRPDGKIDVQGPVYITYCKFKKLPLSFGNISGDCDFMGTSLTTLEGAPEKVGGFFRIQSTKCTSLKGAPEYVGKDFYCTGVPITSLEYSPSHIGGFIDVRHTKIPNLIGLTSDVKSVYCGEDYAFRSFEGCPEVLDDFKCISGGITSLEYSPKTVNNYTIMTCQNLETLDGIPKSMDTLLIQFCRKIKNISMPHAITCNTARVLLNEVAEINELNSDEQVLLLKYQPYYDLWNEDGTLNKQGLSDFIEDVKDGLE